MAIFNRRKSQSISDLENYYANRNNSTGRAWAMALLSLLVTVSVLAAMFFGVRWIYRAMTDNKTTVVTTTQPTNTDTSDTNVAVVDPTPAPSSSQNSSEHSDHTTPPSEPNGVVSEQAARTTTPSASSRTQGASSTPRTGDSDALPNTGTGELVFVLPFAAAVLGYFISRKYYINQ